jgi:hypothetical protein
MPRIWRHPKVKVMTPELVEGLRKTLKEASESKDLTNWETTFAMKNLQRLDKTGKKTYFSDKQLERIEQIKAKINGE